MPAISLPLVAGFAVTILGQFIALAMIPATRGFTALWPTLICIVSIVFSIGVSAKMVQNGLELSVLTPIATVALQIFVIFVAVTFYGEAASPAKIGLLLLSAVMIGIATRL